MPQPQTQDQAPDNLPPTPKLWERRATEQSSWYDRFLTYLALGPSRTIEATYRQRRTIEKGLTAARPTGYWHTRAGLYEWDIRAAAYDRERSGDVLASEELRKVAARALRRSIVEELLGATHLAIKAADLLGMDIATARRNLPTLRALLHDLLMAHRLELGEPTEIQQETSSSSITFSADDLAEAQRQLATGWRPALEPESPADAA